MLVLARLEDEPKSGAIFVYLFVSATQKMAKFPHTGERGLNSRLREYSYSGMND